MKKNTLDAIDIRILSALQMHGQLSKSKLAELVNLSQTPCWARLEKLKQNGFIKGYHASLNFNKIIDLTRVFVTVSLKKHQKADFDRFESHIQHVDEIIDCHATGGGNDYVMNVITKNITHFQTVMDDLLNADIGIDRYIIYVITREIKTSIPKISNLLS